MKKEEEEVKNDMNEGRMIVGRENKNGIGQKIIYGYGFLKNLLGLIGLFAS